MIRVSKSGDRLELRFAPSDKEFMAWVRSIPGRKWIRGTDVKYDPHWTIPEAYLPNLLASWPGQMPEGDAQKTVWFDNGSAESAGLLSRLNQIRALKTTFQPADIAIDLFPFQRVAVSFLRRLDCALLHDGVGVGKSLEAIAWANHHPPPRLVVCTASTKYFYAAEIARGIPGATVGVVNGMSGPFPENVQWVVINFDLLRSSKSRRLEQILAYGFKTVIFSEAHKMKSGTRSMRGQAALWLGEAIPYRLCETATPMPNGRPEELVTILRVLGKLRKEEEWPFKWRYCSPQKVKINRRGETRWDFSGSSNTEELNTMLSGFSIGRQRREVVADLPPVVYQNLVVDMDKAYRESEKEVLDLIWMLRKLRKKWREAGVSPDPEQEMILEAKLRGEILAARGRIKYRAAMSKLPYTFEQLSQRIEAGSKVVVFSDFLDPIHDMPVHSLHCGAIIIEGATDAKTREALRDKFQTDPNTRIALVSRAAGGEGITLTAADTVMFNDLPWSATEFTQAVGRVDRTGQTQNVTVVSMLGRDSIDSAIVQKIFRKSETTAKIFPGESYDEQAERFREMLEEL